MDAAQWLEAIGIQRSVTFYTPNKVYSGMVDIKSEEMRTIDLLNSSNLYWKKPTDKNFSDSIQLNQAKIRLQGGASLGGFSRLQMRLSDIIFFTDELKRVGNSRDKKRETSLAIRTKETESTVRIITKTSGDTFYTIRGRFVGLFRNKSQKRYLPIMNAKVSAVTRVGDKWVSNRLVMDTFIGLSTDHIESCAFN